MLFVCFFVVHPLPWRRTAIRGEIYNWEELQVEPASFRSDGDALLSEYRSNSPDFAIPGP